jgi:hypothetical protein
VLARAGDCGGSRGAPTPPFRGSGSSVTEKSGGHSAISLTLLNVPFEAWGFRADAATIFNFLVAYCNLVERELAVGGVVVGAVVDPNAFLTNLTVDELDGGERLDAAAEDDTTVFTSLKTSKELEGAGTQMRVRRCMLRGPGASGQHSHRLKYQVGSRVTLEQLAFKTVGAKARDLADRKLAGLIACAVEAVLGGRLGREWCCVRPRKIHARSAALRCTS